MSNIVPGSVRFQLSNSMGYSYILWLGSWLGFGLGFQVGLVSRLGVWLVEC